MATDWQGRSKEQVERNESCCEVIVDAFIALAFVAGVGYLVALVLGWLG